MGTPPISTSTVRVLHRSLTIDREFEPFTGTLEKILVTFPQECSRTFSSARNRPHNASKPQKAPRS
jgi:hypothetical protein